MRLLSVVAVLAAACLRADAADPVASAASRALAGLRSSLRSADGLHARAVRDLTVALRRGTSTPREAFDTHASALALLSQRAAVAADTAASAFLDDVTSAMAAAADESLRGAVPGAGGALETFAVAVRRDLERVRARADARLRAFGRTFTNAGGGATEFRARLPVWDFDLAAAPSATGTLPAPDAAPSVRTISAARLPDGRLVVAAAGTSGASYSGLFDLRMRGAALVVIPPKLSEGGIDVAETGTWSVAAELGDPFAGNVPPPGNRVLQFGTEPFDGGLAGRQPGRLVAAGVFGLP